MLDADDRLARPRSRRSASSISAFPRTATTRWRAGAKRRIVERMVAAYRRYRPDIVDADLPRRPRPAWPPPRHDRRPRKPPSTLAADPDAFPEQIAAGLRPGRSPSTTCRPGRAAAIPTTTRCRRRDATVAVDAPGRDPATGADLSRRSASGRAPIMPRRAWAAGATRRRTRWPLHLAASATAPTPRTTSATACRRPSATLRRARATPAHGGRAARCPDGDRRGRRRVSRSARRSSAAALARPRRDRCGARRPVRRTLAPRIGHRLARKALEIDARAARGGRHRAACPCRTAAPGAGRAGHRRRSSSAPTTSAARSGRRAGKTASRSAMPPDRRGGRQFPGRRDAAPPAVTRPYPPAFDPLAAQWRSRRHRHRQDRRAHGRLAPSRPRRRSASLPAASLVLDPDAVIVNLARPPAPVTTSPRASMALPRSVVRRRTGRLGGRRATAAASPLTPPLPSLPPGRFTVTATVDGRIAIARARGPLSRTSARSNGPSRRRLPASRSMRRFRKARGSPMSAAATTASMSGCAGWASTSRRSMPRCWRAATCRPSPPSSSASSPSARARTSPPPAGGCGGGSRPAAIW